MIYGLSFDARNGIEEWFFYKTIAGKRPSKEEFVSHIVNAFKNEFESGDWAISDDDALESARHMIKGRFASLLIG